MDISGSSALAFRVKLKETINLLVFLANAETFTHKHRTYTCNSTVSQAADVRISMKKQGKGPDIP